MTMLFGEGLAIAAVAFDMDGLMFDSEAVACDLWARAGKAHGWDIPQDAIHGLIGLSAPRGRQHLMETLGPDFPYDSIRADRIAFEAVFYKENDVPLKAGLKELLSFLKAASIPMAVATSTVRPRVLPLLEKSGVIDVFKFALCGDEVTHTKPHPEMYSTAISRLGSRPENCMVLEDSRAGIAAAHAAGALPVLVPDMLEPDAITRQRAVREFKTLLEVRDWLSEFESGSIAS
jgi:HAD superfamily hydrolase (TIGR01549 family)